MLLGFSSSSFGSPSRPGRRNRDSVERQILTRTSKQPETVHTDTNALFSQPKSSLHLDPALRFHSPEFALQERVAKEKLLSRYSNYLDERREKTKERENKEEKKREIQSNVEEQKLAKDKNLGFKTKSNALSLARNPLTLEYHNTPQGRKLQYQDDCSQYRAALRRKILHQNSNGKFNPITGEPLREVPMPSKPTPPSIANQTNSSNNTNSNTN
jgi:hypothetical protein